MSSKVSFWLLLRLAILLAAFLAQSGEGATTYQDFRNRHVAAAPRRGANLDTYCNLLMQERKIPYIPGKCKPRNTFINDVEGAIQNICRGGGTWWKNSLYNSIASFPLVDCNNRGTYPNCKYVGRTQEAKICVGCDVNWLPVHFEAIL